MAADLSFVGMGTEGLLFTDGQSLYLVWERTSNNDRIGTPEQYRWFGMKVDTPSRAFPAVAYPSFCGAEVDMRQTDDDPMTEEVMELGDRVAEALNRYFKDAEKRICKEWEARNGR